MKIDYYIKKVLFRLRGRILTFRPKNPNQLRVLISHELTGFFLPTDHPLTGHGLYWVAIDTVQAFLEKGYTVDVIHWQNATFVPKRQYAYFLDIHSNLERLAPLLNKDCIKILHICAAHWLFQNAAEYQRCLDVQQRKKVTIFPNRVMAPTRSIEYADRAIMFGNDFTRGTYEYAGKDIHAIPLPTTNTYPSPQGKDFEKAKFNFVWVGGGGGVHKGLDLVLEAFAAMPEYRLSIFGKGQSDPDFAQAFHKELHNTPNIKNFGYVDLNDSLFREACSQSVGIVFPSCSEGSAGSVIAAMHAGLIPIISRETGIDTKTFGITLTENTVKAIQESVRAVAALSLETLTSNALDTWEYARRQYTRERFSADLRNYIEELESGRAQP